MFKQQSEDLGKLVLRLAVGGMMLWHGIAKLSSGVGMISGMLEAKGFPGFLAYGVYVGEIVAPVMIILGFWTRLGAFLLGGTMVVAIWLAHMDDIFKYDERGQWLIELQMFYLASSLALFFLGGGRYGLTGGKPSGA